MEKCLSGFLVKVAITFLGRQSRQKRAYIITNPKTLEGKSPSISLLPTLPLQVSNMQFGARARVHKATWEGQRDARIQDHESKFTATFALQILKIAFGH